MKQNKTNTKRDVIRKQPEENKEIEQSERNPKRKIQHKKKKLMLVVFLN